MKKILRIACVAMVFVLAGCSNRDLISLITREEGSGTRGAFVEIIGISEKGFDNTTLDAIVHDGTGKVMTAVRNDQNAMGYISLGSLNETVKAISIDGVPPSIENIQNGSYKISRPFNIAFKEEKSVVAEDFIRFITSKTGQKIVEEQGFIGIYANGEFTSSLKEGNIVIGGSTSVYPLMEKLAEAYKTINSNASINIEAIGSSAGIKGVIDGTFDIGMASRTLKEDEKSQVSNMEIAKDGIIIISNRENPLGNLSIEEIKGIYTGILTSFADLTTDSTANQSAVQK